jgi:hypothetical protein
MKKIAIRISVIFLFVTGSFAQQSKPSPSTPASAAPELKQRVKTEPAASTAAATPATLPVGTPVRMRLETALSTSSTQAGDTFSGRVLEDVKLNQRVILPVGATLQGEVVRVSEPRRIKGKPMIQLLPQVVVLPNGQKYPINAAVADTNKVNGTSVDDEGRIKGPGHTDRDVMEIAAGAGVGAIVGGIAKGGKGSLIGAGIGAGGTIIHWLTKRNSASLPVGSEIIFELSRPMVVGTVQMAENLN